MALIHVFNGINKKTTYTFNGRLRDNLTDVNWKNAVILRNGYRVNPDYEVGADDVIFVRKTPTAATTVAIAVGATAIVASGVAVGVSIYQNKKATAEIEEAQQASKAGAESASQLPYIRGAKNQAATGRTFPYLIGKSLITPYRLCPAHYTIAGTHGVDQYYNVVLEVAYNNIVFDKIKMGETVIKTLGGTTPQNGVYNFDNSIYYDERNIIEIRQTGAFTNDDFNKKYILTELNTEIPHRHASTDPTENAKIEAEWRAGVVQELPTHAQSVEVIALFDGLQQYNGGWGSQLITLSPQWTNVDNPSENDWHDFSNGFNQDGTYSNSFTYNTAQQMRFIATQEFSAAQAYGKNIKIRVRRMTPKAESNAKDTVYLMAVQTKCYDDKKSSVSGLVTADVLEAAERDKCCRIGLRIAANLNTSGQLGAISCIASGCARTWNGTTWSNTKTPTSNLAAWMLEILTSDKHAPSRYSDSELDLGSFGALYQYCQQLGFKADGLITSNKRKKDILNTLCKNSNSALVYNAMTGLMEVAIDNGRDYSVALLNSENIISISTTKEFKRKTDGKKVTYINSAAGYDVDSVVFMRDGGSYDPASDTLTESTLEFVTSYEHAFKYAWRQMAEELAQPRIVTVRAGRESAYYPLYSRVELQHKSLKIGLAHGVIKALVWQNNILKQIILDGSVTFPQSVACGVIINCVSPTGRGLAALKVSGTGKTNTLNVETTLSSSAEVIPTAGNILSFGQLDNDGNFTTVVSSMKITNAEENDDGFTLTLVDYNADLYSYGTLPTYKSNLTSVPNGSKKTVAEQRDYITTGDAQALNSGVAQAAVDTIKDGYTFSNVYRVKAYGESLEEIIAKIDEEARNRSANISISEDEILLQVQEVERGLVGLIDIQAGSVTAMVAGGGATGQMSLSLNLPVMIDAQKRADLIAASSQAKFEAVYALVEGTEYYGIKGNASNAAVKALWDDAVTAGLIASQIILSADQIQLAGKTVFTSSKTESVASDVATTAANAAQAAAEETAAADATNKANSAQSAAEAEAERQRQALITALSEDATAGHTVIDGGYLKTALIDVENILTKNIIVKDKGVLRSLNYNGTIDANGNITTYGTAGWAIDHAGKSDFYGIHTVGDIESSDFSTSNIRGYKLYKKDGVGRADLPILYTANIYPLIPGRSVEFYEVTGVTSRNFRTELLSRITSWADLFNKLNFPTYDLAYGVHCNGFIGGNAIQRFTLAYVAGEVNMFLYGYQPDGTYKNPTLNFPLDSPPSVTIDILF